MDAMEGGVEGQTPLDEEVMTFHAMISTSVKKNKVQASQFVKMLVEMLEVKLPPYLLLAEGFGPCWSGFDHTIYRNLAITKDDGNLAS